MSMNPMAGQMAEKAALKAKIIAMKRGKTPEQMKCIDFFMTEPAGGCSKAAGSTMSISEYMQLVSQKGAALNLRNKVLDKIGLDESQVREINPIVLASFNYDDDCLVKVEKQMVVSSQYSISWIFFSRDQMFTYTYTFDMVSDNTWETMRDYFYKDITCVTTARNVKEKIELSYSGCMGSTPTATKTDYVVDVFKIIVPGDEVSFSMRNSTSMEQSIKAAKALIREKKCR